MKKKGEQTKGTITITINFDLSQDPSVSIGGIGNAWNDLFFVVEALGVLSLPALGKSPIKFDGPDEFHNYILRMVSDALKEYPSFFKR